MFQADGADFDVVFLKKLTHIVLAEPHRVVPDVDLMRSPENQSTHTRDDYRRKIVAFEEDVKSSPKISFSCL